MAWGNPPPEDKPPPRGPTLSNFMPTPSEQQYPSLCAKSSGGVSATQHKLPSANVPAQSQASKLLPYHVTGSKKGGFPVAVEKRNCGKKVTLIRNVVGDRSALLSGLKKKLGCGGVINKDGNIEIQGERQPAVEKYLTEMNCLKSVSKANKEVSAAPTRVTKVAEPTKIDKKMAAARAPAKDGPAVALSSITEQAAKKMKPAEMKVHLKAAGVSIQENKKELLARLLEHIK